MLCATSAPFWFSDTRTNYIAQAGLELTRILLPHPLYATIRDEPPCAAWIFYIACVSWLKLPIVLEEKKLSSSGIYFLRQPCWSSKLHKLYKDNLHSFCSLTHASLFTRTYIYYPAHSYSSSCCLHTLIIKLPKAMCQMRLSRGSSKSLLESWQFPSSPYWLVLLLGWNLFILVCTAGVLE